MESILATGASGQVMSSLSPSNQARGTPVGGLLDKNIALTIKIFEFSQYCIRHTGNTGSKITSWNRLFYEVKCKKKK